MDHDDTTTLKAVPDSSQLFRYAGFWRRVAACVIDTLLLGVTTAGLMKGFALGFIATTGASNPMQIEAFRSILGLCVIVLWWLYYALLEFSHIQGTVGKLALRIKVTNLTGQRLSFGQASGRFFGKFVSFLIRDRKSVV